MSRRLKSDSVSARPLRVTLFAVLMACMLATVFVVSMPTARAKTFTAVEGKMVWDLNTLRIIKALPANGNTILWGATTVYVTGDFAGTATDSWKEILISTGALNLWDVMVIPTSLSGKSGTVTLLLEGRAAAPGSHWTGQWVILISTGGLAGLHGFGIWWTADVGYDFSGEVRFV
jgi:hypothetical protein